MGFDNLHMKAYSVHYSNEYKVLLSNKLVVNKEQLIVVDLEKILFIQKLILKGIDTKII